MLQQRCKGLRFVKRPCHYMMHTHSQPHAATNNAPVSRHANTSECTPKHTTLINTQTHTNIYEHPTPLTVAYLRKVRWLLS